jgi:hypothetical protein
MAWSTPRTWVAGEKPTAATMNTHIRDQLNALGDAWTAFTPTWTAATTNPAIGNGTIVGAYRQIGKAVDFNIVITMGSTTTYGSGAYSLTVPVAVKAARSLSMGVARDASSGFSYPIALEFIGIGSTTGSARVFPTTAGIAFASLSSTAPFTFAVSDVITLTGTYEAA